jgi:tryptophanyl-tRNA synthetase
MHLLHRGLACPDHSGYYPRSGVKYLRNGSGLAAGIRPQESILFVQSHVPEVTELHVLLSMVTMLGKLTDLPTFKEKVREQAHNINYGLVGYPVLMAADILLYKATAVPVGLDQAPHLEFTREIVRSFNFRYKTSALLEPQMKITETPIVLGIDGVHKMSKSLNNDIELAATSEETAARVMQMVTDPARLRRNDPGNPDVCNVFSMHKYFSGPDEIQLVNMECRKAGIGCVDCKKILAKNINAHLIPFRQKRAEIKQNPQVVWEILYQGAVKARIIAAQTMEEVRTAVGLPERKK